MSATFLKEDAAWIRSVPKQNLSEFEKAIIVTTFDSETEMDINKIKKEKHMKKVCLLRLLTFPLEVVLGLFVFGIKFPKHHYKVSKVYYKYFRNKISYAEFQKSLQYILNSGKMYT